VKAFAADRVTITIGHALRIRAQMTVLMRKKEGLADYRYFPEPDLPPLVVTPEAIEAARASMPELPSALRDRLVAAGVPVTTALVLAADELTARFFDAAVAAGADVVQAANWIARDLLGWCKENGVPCPPRSLCLWGHHCSWTSQCVSGRLQSVKGTSWR
jgi:Asp-tRNA(Asn)/Glu-tRNA(Gln) amidotransferase B subunit